MSSATFLAHSTHFHVCLILSPSLLLSLAHEASVAFPHDAHSAVGKCPPFGSFYVFSAHAATKMVPVSVILSPPCSLPPAPSPIPNVPCSCLLSLLHIWFTDSGVNQKTCHGLMGAKLSLSKWLLLKRFLHHRAYLNWRVWWAVVGFWRAHRGLSIPVTYEEVRAVLGSSVYCSLEGLGGRLFSSCPWAGQGRRKSPPLSSILCVRTGNWVKWSPKQGHGGVLLSESLPAKPWEISLSD